MYEFFEDERGVRRERERRRGKQEGWKAGKREDRRVLVEVRRERRGEEGKRGVIPGEPNN